MKTASLRLSYLPLSRVSVLMLAFALALAAAFTLGCGSSSSQSPGSGLTGNTSVTVLLSSTANDQLSQFNVGLNSLTLTSQGGNSVNLFTASQSNRSISGIEFIHLNGTAEPLVTVSVPQDTYTSATATIGSYPGYVESAWFTCVSLDSSGEVQNSTFALSGTSPSTVKLPSPITVSGTAMGLSLDLQVGQSATYSSCQGGAGVTFSITPTFNLSPVAVSSQPTNVENGKASGIDGQVSSVSATGNNFSMVTTDGAPLSLIVSGSTVYQGITGLSALVAGMAVDTDATVQPDGSLLATRLAVEDMDTTTLSALGGPLLSVWASQPTLGILGRGQQGYLFASRTFTGGFGINFGSAVFRTSGQFTNLQDLPFSASFNGTNMFAGQNVYITSRATSISGGPVPATTITLIPQTINGTVVGVSGNASFQVYSVALASYDLPPILAMQTDLAQSYTLNNSGTVEVYVDSNTQLLNRQPLNPGSAFRFNGLLFNDDRTMRMDCGQVNDGVGE